MKKIAALLLLTSIFSLTESFAQTGAKTQSPKITGTWTTTEFGYQMNLVLGGNSQGEFDGDPIAFSVQGSNLAITQEGVKTIYAFTLSGNSLTLSGGDLDKPLTFTRSGSSSQAPIPAAGSSAFVGVWSGYNEVIEFRNDGQCIYQGQTYRYTSDADEIRIATSEGDFVMRYALNGSQLNLVINGQTLTYKKGGSTGTAKANTAGKTLDQSLVGKWCYVNITSTNTGGTSADECITINADGTYEYYSERSMSANTPSLSAGTASQNSDRGTWWVEGDRVYYNSQSNGSGSYQVVKRNHPKTGDAMIVLDGTAYVTYYNRSPW